MTLNWDDLRIFLTLSREGTLTRAAKALGVSELTASHTLANLSRREADLLGVGGRRRSAPVGTV